MTTYLITPTDQYKRPRAVVRTQGLRVALDATQVTPACRWFTFDELYAVEANRRDLDYLMPIQGCRTADEQAAALAAIAASAERAKAQYDFGALWLGIANGILARATLAVNVRRAVAESELLAA